MENLLRQLDRMPELFAGHVVLTAAALVVGVSAALPLSIAASRHPAARRLVLSVSGLIQTIPSLALLALMVPLLGGAIGFWPAFTALFLYSLFPVLRNTVTGLAEVDTDYLDAARAVGMTPVQKLLRVELPLSLPFILAGIRTAAVWTVGMATLSTPVGAQSLGNYIFSGLQTRNWTSVLVGCVSAAFLAILLDRLISLFESGVTRKSSRRMTAAGAALAVLFFGGIGLQFKESWQGRAIAPLRHVASDAQQPAASPFDLTGVRVRIGAKTFTEQYILADLLQRRLSALGANVSFLENLGSTIVFDALQNDQIDLYIDYTGTIWANVMQREDPIERNALYVEMAAHLLSEQDILTLGRLGFENAYGFAMRRDRAEALNIRSISDLGAVGDRLRIGGDQEFFARPEWRRVRDAYGLQGASTTGMDATFMYDAVRNDQVDVIGAFTTDGRIDAYDLVLLADPAGAFPPYDAVLLVSPEARTKPNLLHALGGFVKAIDGDMMRAANGRVDIDGAAPETAAGELYDALFAE